MKKYAIVILFSLSILVSNAGYSQSKPTDIVAQTLHLQLAPFYYFVVNEGRVDLDSALYMVTKQFGISSSYMIGEKMQDILSEYGDGDINSLQIME